MSVARSSWPCPAETYFDPRSTSRTLRPSRAQVAAQVPPPAPLPITITSKSYGIVPEGFRVGRWAVVIPESDTHQLVISSSAKVISVQLRRRVELTGLHPHFTVLS